MEQSSDSDALLREKIARAMQPLLDSSHPDHAKTREFCAAISARIQEATREMLEAVAASERPLPDEWKMTVRAAA